MFGAMEPRENIKCTLVVCREDKYSNKAANQYRARNQLHIDDIDTPDDFISSMFHSEQQDGQNGEKM